MAHWPRILLTAFEPFGGRELNPSQVLLESLLARRAARPEGVEGLLLPVRLADAWPMLLARLEVLDPDVVLAMGEAGGREEICLEARAFNELDLRVPDNAGLQPRGERILEEGPERLDSDLPLAVWVERLGAMGHRIALSEDAGRHLCNMTLYRLLERQQREGQPRATFVHLPLLPEQLSGEGDECCMSQEAQRSAIEDLLELLLTEPLPGS